MSNMKDHKYHYKNPKPHYHDVKGNKLHYISGQGWVSKMWRDLFLSSWNRAVELWDSGKLFEPQYDSYHKQEQKMREQQEYAQICCVWLIPNGVAEPHVVAEGG